MKDSLSREPLLLCFSRPSLSKGGPQDAAPFCVGGSIRSHSLSRTSHNPRVLLSVRSKFLELLFGGLSTLPGPSLEPLRIRAGPAVKIFPTMRCSPSRPSSRLSRRSKSVPSVQRLLVMNALRMSQLDPCPWTVHPPVSFSSTLPIVALCLIRLRER